MVNKLVRAVQFARRTHTDLSSVRQDGFMKRMKSVCFSVEHFPKVLGFTFLISAVSGFMMMDYKHKKRLEVSTVVFTLS